MPDFNLINKFVEVHPDPFTPLSSLNDIVTDVDCESNLVADVDPDIFNGIGRSELKQGKAADQDNAQNKIYQKAIDTGFSTCLV